MSEQNAQKLKIVNAAGTPFNVRVVLRGDGYGLDHALAHETDEPLVEFYDARFENDARFDKGLGQFVSRYRLSTLVNHRNMNDGGLTLFGGAPTWALDRASLYQAVEWAESMVGAAANVMPDTLLPTADTQGLAPGAA